MIRPKGLINQIKEAGTKVYGKLTLKDLEKTIKDLSMAKTFSPSFTIFTGLGGMRVFDLMMMFEAAGVQGNFTIEYFFSFYPRSRNKSFDVLRKKDRKRSDFTYLSLVKKEGLYKLKFYHDRKFPLHLYKGTELVFQSNNLEDINNLLK